METVSLEAPVSDTKTLSLSGWVWATSQTAQSPIAFSFVWFWFFSNSHSFSLNPGLSGDGQRTVPIPQVLWYRLGFGWDSASPFGSRHPEDCRWRPASEVTVWRPLTSVQSVQNTQQPPGGVLLTPPLASASLSWQVTLLHKITRWVFVLTEVWLEQSSAGLLAWWGHLQRESRQQQQQLNVAPLLCWPLLWGLCTSVRVWIQQPGCRASVLTHVLANWGRGGLQKERSSPLLKAHVCFSFKLIVYHLLLFWYQTRTSVTFLAFSQIRT